MLTNNEIVEILKVAAGYDNRKPNESMRDAWLEAANRARWTVVEAHEAVHAHYGEHGEWLMPGHVTSRILARRHRTATRPLNEVLRDPRTGVNPDEVISTEADRREFLAEIRSALATKGRSLEFAPTPPPADDDGNACLDVTCPWCHAPVGSRCTTLRRPMRRRACHPARSEARTGLSA